VKVKDTYYERQERKKQWLMELVAQPDTDGGDVLAGTLMAPTPEEHRVGVEVPTMNRIAAGTHSSYTTPLGTDRCIELLPDGDSNSSASLANRQTRWVTCLPHCFHNVLPEPPAALPPPELVAARQPPVQAHEMSDVSMFHQDVETFLQSAVSFQLQSTAAVRSTTLDTQWNQFGIFQCYFGHQFLSHDTDQLLRTDIEGMSDIPNHMAPTEIFGPYHNQSSFLLGE
jgi:hypothetical protein